MPLSRLLRNLTKRTKAPADLEEVYREVFGEIGEITLMTLSQPDIYADYDRCLEVMAKMRSALDTLANT